MVACPGGGVHLVVCQWGDEPRRPAQANGRALMDTLTTATTYRMMSDHEVQMVKDNMSEFNVKFHGPKDSK